MKTFIEYTIEKDQHPTGHISIRIKRENKAELGFAYIFPELIGESVIDRIMKDMAIRIKATLEAEWLLKMDKKS